MKRLYKKIIAGMLSAVLIGGVLSSELVVFASSDESSVFDNLWVRNDYDDIADIKGAVNIYHYKILGINPSEAALKIVSRSRSISDKLKYFKNSDEFFSYLKESGIKQGVYKVKIDKNVFLLEFLKNIPKGIDILDNLCKLVGSREKDISRVQGAKGIHFYQIIGRYSSKKDIPPEYVKLPFKKYKSGLDFIVDLCFWRPDGEMWLFEIGSQFFVIKFDKLYK